MSEDQDVTKDEGRPAAPRVTIKEGYVKRRGHVEFDGDYDGRFVDVWINCPKRVVNGLASDSVATVDQAVSIFVLDHNLVYPLDEERPADAGDDWRPAFRAGEQMPIPLNLTAVGEVPIDLYRRVVELGIEAVQKAAELPKRRG